MADLRKGNDTVLVIDSSKSMAGQLAAFNIKQFITEFFKSGDFPENNRLSIVTYGAESTLTKIGTAYAEAAVDTLIMGIFGHDKIEVAASAPIIQQSVDTAPKTVLSFTEQQTVQERTEAALAANDNWVIQNRRKAA